MPINPERLGLALDRLGPGDWERFERLCHAFFASEFGDSYRPMAAPSGDQGRDGELFSPEGRANVVFQFSVQKDWRAKVRATVARLKVARKNTVALIYATNQDVGALADDIKGDLRGRPLLDVRDRSWFVSRANSDENRAQAAQALYDAMVGPSKTDRPIPNVIGDLTSDESRTLLFFLELQHGDNAADKGLTKASYEALVRAALRYTTAATAVKKDDIYKRIALLLPQHDLETQLKEFIDGALTRLLKSVVKYNRTTDEYHLANEEHERLTDRAAAVASLRAGFLADLEDDLALDPRIDPEDLIRVRDYAASVIELYLHSRGEAFASAVVEGTSLVGDDSELSNAIAKQSPKPKLRSNQNIAQICLSVVPTFLRTPTAETLAYLKLLSDCYTLFAFLAATPDVQKATKKLFDQGEIWLDTSVVLPALAEWQKPDGSAYDRPFQFLFRQLNASGLTLHVSEGVIEEILGHLNRCVFFARSTHWKGAVPYVASQFLIAGGAVAGIPSFVEEFRGDHKPEAAMTEFLKTEYGIAVTPLADFAPVPAECRETIVDYWQAETDKRKGERLDDMSALRLARHDSENYLNVLARRKLSDQGTWLGYTCWWLTLDGAAKRLLNNVTAECQKFVAHQPIMSLDFLTQYLTFGPMRSRIDRDCSNPLDLYAAAIAESVPADLISKAQAIRTDLGDLSERRKIRRITATLDQQRSEFGAIHGAGIDRVSAAMLGDT